MNISMKSLVNRLLQCYSAEERCIAEMIVRLHRGLSPANATDPVWFGR